MSREAHVQFCESLGVQLPGATHRNIYVGSERAGKRVMQSVTGFIRRRLKLKVNAAKSAVARPQERKFLGFSFTGGREPKRRVAPKALDRCKQKLRALTRRTRGISVEQRAKELATYLRGWKSYFGFCETPSVLRVLDQWLRRRLRATIWKQWKHGKARFRRLRQRNIGTALAARRQSPWLLAPGQQPGPVVRLSHCLLRFARSPSVIGRALAQPH